MIDNALIRKIRHQFALKWNGIHGLSHWIRVRENGLRLAQVTGAKAHVVELFAYLHDSRRLNNDYDPEHGLRAAEFVRKLSGSSFVLGAGDLDILATACRGHCEGLKEGDVTVLTCWDADRLDLGRVGIKPNPDRLCTEAGRDPAIIEWAYERSLK